MNWQTHNAPTIKAPGYLQVLLVSSTETPDGQYCHLICLNRQTVLLHSKLNVDDLKALLQKLRYSKGQHKISKWDMVTHIWQAEHDGIFLTIFCSNGLYHAVDCADPLFLIKPIYRPVPQPAESDPQSEVLSEIPTDIPDPDADDQTETPLLSLAEAAELLGVSQRTIRRRCETGVIQGELGTDARLYVRIAAAPVE